MSVSLPSEITDLPGVAVSWRRAGVVLLAVAIGGAALATWHDQPPATLAGIVTALALYVALRRTIDHLADKPDEQLDERLVAQRNTTYFHAFRLYSVVVGLALLGLFIAADGYDLAVTSNHLNALFVSLFGLSVMLPTMLIAWRRDV